MLLLVYPNRDGACVTTPTTTTATTATTALCTTTGSTARAVLARGSLQRSRTARMVGSGEGSGIRGRDYWRRVGGAQGFGVHRGMCAWVEGVPMSMFMEAELRPSKPELPSTCRIRRVATGNGLPVSRLGLAPNSVPRRTAQQHRARPQRFSAEIIVTFPVRNDSGRLLPSTSEAVRYSPACMAFS